VDILDRLPASGGTQEGGSGGILDQLGGSDTAPAPEPEQPAVPNN
jgi:hypothetical protein